MMKNPLGLSNVQKKIVRLNFLPSVKKVVLSIVCISKRNCEDRNLRKSSSNEDMHMTNCKYFDGSCDLFEEFVMSNS